MNINTKTIFKVYDDMHLPTHPAKYVYNDDFDSMFEFFKWCKQHGVEDKVSQLCNNERKIKACPKCGSYEEYQTTSSGGKHACAKCYTYKRNIIY